MGGDPAHGVVAIGVGAVVDVAAFAEVAGLVVFVVRGKQGRVIERDGLLGEEAVGAVAKVAGELRAEFFTGDAAVFVALDADRFVLDDADGGCLVEQVVFVGCPVAEAGFPLDAVAVFVVAVGKAEGALGFFEQLAFRVGLPLDCSVGVGGFDQVAVGVVGEGFLAAVGRVFLRMRPSGSRRA
jgi:hypothetical protein